MEKITINVDAGWLRLAKSPWMLLVSALTGISITFAPIALFQLGQTGATFLSPLFWVYLSIIYLVPGLYIKLALNVLNQLGEVKINSKPLEDQAKFHNTNND